MKLINKENKKWQWAKCVIAIVLYAAFLLWIGSWWGVIVIPFIFDAYITHKINWGWWRDLENSFLVTLMSWVDAIVFALVAVYFVNIYFFQNYTIPSSSLEKSLLVGDYLFVSKMSYGPRKPITPLTIPLTQHTAPWGTKSYLEWPQWEYERVSPKPVELNDIVVFNFPGGDTICSDPRYQASDYHQLCYQYGKQLFENQYGALPPIDNLNPLELWMQMHAFRHYGSAYIKANQQEFGEVMWRPVDRRENYVKRCVGLPGDTLQIRMGKIYLNGVQNKQPDNVQHNYRVSLNTRFLPDTVAQRLGISKDDLSILHTYGYLPLTKRMVTELAKCPFVSDINYLRPSNEDTFPYSGNRKWTIDDMGPIWIPKKGATINLDLHNLPLYERCITAYEGNTLSVNDSGDIIINGKKATKYTFKMDYYWMQGDNRHNSLDSRYWGFVPEDHIVGKPIMVWFSVDKDYGIFSGGIRWHRLFRWVENYN